MIITKCYSQYRLENDLRKKPSWVLVLSVLIFIAGLSLSCAGDIQYDTIADRTKLLGLQNKTVAIISLQYNENAFRGSPMDATVVKLLLEEHKSLFLNEFGDLFNFKQLPDSDASSLANSEIDPQNSDLIRKLVEDLDLDGVFVINSAYGFTDVNVTQYWFASNTHLLDKEGRIVWNFYGKAWGFQTLSEGLSPQELARKVTGEENLPAGFVHVMTSMTENYIPFLRWLMEMDIEGVPNKNYFTHYQEDKKNENIAIYPASYNTSPYILDTSSR